MLDNILCVLADIDECLDNPCQQQCSNTKGSYECTCSEGYVDDGVILRGQDCKAVGKLQNFDGYIHQKIEI